VWVSVGFGVSEYTLVFRSEPGGARADSTWSIVRPVQYTRIRKRRAGNSEHAGVARLFAVPICSALALEGIAYEQFLNCSGVLDESLRLLADMPLDDPCAVETTRRQIQSLVMAAEVDNIVSIMMKGA
jgi:hypothetical protein